MGGKVPRAFKWIPDEEVAMRPSATKFPSNLNKQDLPPV